MVEVFGEGITELGFFQFGFFKFNNTEQVVARSGYSSQNGYEIYLNDSSLGPELWDSIWKTGAKYSIRPGAPNLIDRIEAGLISFGNDMTNKNTPLECGLGKYCSLNSDTEFLGKEDLIKEKSIGSKSQMRGIVFGGKSQSACTEPWPVLNGEVNIGQITSGIFNPNLRVNTGIALIEKGYWELGQRVSVVIDSDDIREGRVCFLPFTALDNNEVIQSI